MKRIAIVVTASALALALLLSGCGKTTAKVDTSPKHTTAPVTMAPDDPENVQSDLDANETANPADTTDPATT